jgi:hypothetical protein
MTMTRIATRKELTMEDKPGEIIVHVNGDGLDNRRSNLTRKEPQWK